MREKDKIEKNKEFISLLEAEGFKYRRKKDYCEMVKPIRVDDGHYSLKNIEKLSICVHCGYNWNKDIVFSLGNLTRGVFYLMNFNSDLEKIVKNLDLIISEIKLSHLGYLEHRIDLDENETIWFSGSHCFSTARGFIKLHNRCS